MFERTADENMDNNVYVYHLTCQSERTRTDDRGYNWHCSVPLPYISYICVFSILKRLQKRRGKYTGERQMCDSTRKLTGLCKEHHTTSKIEQDRSFVLENRNSSEMRRAFEAQRQELLEKTN